MTISKVSAWSHMQRSLEYTDPKTFSKGRQDKKATVTFFLYPTFFSLVLQLLGDGSSAYWSLWATKTSEETRSF